MKLMHTKLPEFLKKVERASNKHLGENSFQIKGLENLETAKMQSLRTGRIEAAIEELALKSETNKIEVSVMPRVPETMHTVIIKSVDENGEPIEAVLELMNIIHPTEEIELVGCKKVKDLRPPLGRH